MANVDSTNKKQQAPTTTSIIHVSETTEQPASSSFQSGVTLQQAGKRANLEERIAKLEQQISATTAKQAEIDSQLKSKDPQAVVKAHIKLLHDYNEIRDVGQGMMGIIAEQRGVRIIDVYRDFGVAEGD